MPFDDVFEILLATRDRHQANLAVGTHDLPVQIETRLRILFERSLANQVFEILLSFRIDARVVKIELRRQIDLGLAHTKKTEWIAFGDDPRLSGRHHIIRQFTDTRRQFGSWAERREWFDGR